MTGMPKDTGFAEVPGGRLYYEVTGDGPTVVLSHEGISDHTIWDEQVGPLSNHFTVVRYDVRGFGLSSRVESDFHPHEDLHALLDGLGIQRAALVGASMSGGIVIDFALVYPESLWALVPVAAGIWGFDYSSDDEANQYEREVVSAMQSGDIERAVELGVRFWVDGPKRTTDAVSPAVRDKMRDLQRAIFAAGGPPEEHAKPLEPHAITRLEEISIPTLVIVGDEDAVAIQQVNELIAQRIPGAQKAVIPDTAHVLMVEKPGEFNRVLLDFLLPHASTL
jgi:3-oxoadipate enol-lactonase